MSVNYKESLLTPEEAAEELRCDIKTMANWRSQGTGPDYARVGRLIRYPASALNRYLNDQLVTHA